ncbi:MULTISPECIES: ParA family protein [Cellulosimicrobium]|uniref:ParA family protein n=1 Tax=Cellulosimicrobium protaetiae TaxID=2587808 RepID=A0A6M5UMZ9_9MICO|nr:ParA family protein [Cellulosimicrobium protaetiae]QJW38775.1 ParA family protein [Cellulosimicrobium protaetiae]
MSETIDREALARVIAMINGKGGVLKTSTTQNVGGQLAEQGMKILLIDTDISGNLKIGLGLVGSPLDDAGKSIVDAVWNGEPFKIARDVRPNLDIIFGGRALEMLGKLAQSSMADELPNGSVAAEFAARLAEIAGEYDLVIIDCPPGNAELQDMALAAARWVLIPAKTDEMSWEGLRGVGPRVKRARRDNETLDYLGVFLTGHNPTATRVYKNTQVRLEEVGDKVPLLRSTIRHSETAAHDTTTRGQLAHELARDVKVQRASRLQALRARRGDEHGSSAPLKAPALSQTANSLADDYKHLAAEVCERITAAEEAGASEQLEGARA